MKRADREITDRAEIDAIIHGSEVCRLAFAVVDEPYIVPVSFGYDGHRLYFHTAKTGKKIDCIAANNRVCFEMERNVRLVPHADKACQWSFSFESVVGLGAVHELTSPEEKAEGLGHIMAHYSDREWTMDADAVSGVRVWSVTVATVSGKRSVYRER